MDLSKVSNRDRLKPKREPHWQRLRIGVFLGFRPSKKGGAGTWIARAYDEHRTRYSIRSLGDFGNLAPRDRFAEAKRAAEAFGDKVASGGLASRKIETVGDACRVYAEGKRDAEGRFQRLVYCDPIASVRLDKLRRRNLREWRERLENMPTQASRTKATEQTARTKAPASINRDMVPLRAALFRVLAPGRPSTEAAWQEALKPIKNADRRRTLYLDRAQRQRLIDATSIDARPFIRALCLLPLRPGAMAKLMVSDFNDLTRELTIGEDKSGRARRITLPLATAELIKKQSVRKLPTAPIFMTANGRAWTKENWNKPIARAAAEAELTPGVTAYTLRHSVLTDLVNGGLPILTVAQLSDTSVEMIERHYGHLNQDQAEQALAKLAP